MGMLERLSHDAQLTRRDEGVTSPAHRMPRIAQVAELVDAQVSGTCGRKVVEVRVFSWAPPALIAPHRRDERLFEAVGATKQRSAADMAGVTQFMANATIHLHRHDLPEGLDLGRVIAVDTETMGLNPHRDRLCLVQISAGDGQAHLVQIIPPELGGHGADCPNLKRVLADPNTVKLMHFARFDVGVLQHTLGIRVAPVKCTKIAAKLVRTFTDRHGLKDLCRELLGVDLSKQQQTSDWGAPELSAEQLTYAASDVLHLHALWAKLEALLKREGRLELAEACFAFLPARGQLDMLGYEAPDIFAH
jgi:ribonuclease D